MTEPHHGPTSRSGGWSRAAAVGLGFEAGLLGVAAVAYAMYAFSSPEPEFTAGLAAFAGIVAMTLVPVARGLARGARWAVSAAVTWQVLLTLAGVTVAGTQPLIGSVAAMLGVAVGIAVVIAGRDALRPAD